MSSQPNIRNFSIIAHIDHGKSTLADRFLEFTHTIEKRKMKEQVLDRMDLERERGITIKLQPVRMNYNSKIPNYKSQITNKLQITNSPPGRRPSRAGGKLQNSNNKYVLNLIDTPGHVDFTYEVSRSLAAVEGAVLLVDATKGIQAQTLSNIYLALEQNLTIIPVINKIDLPNADPDKVAKEMTQTLGIKENEIILASAKDGTGVNEILKAIVDKVPAPKGDMNKPLRALIFDSNYDSYRGVVAYVRVVDGEIDTHNNASILFMAQNQEAEVLEVGVFKPDFKPKEKLQAGEIGYIVTGLKEIEKCRVGDTITKFKVQSSKFKIDALPGYKEPQPKVFASIYCTEGSDYPLLKEALEKLKLNDASLVFEPESNVALGHGFRCGFLGLLHMDIVQERLSREHNLDLVITAPSVSYKILKRGKDKKNSEITIYNPSELPDLAEISEIKEPWSKLEIVTPKNYLGQLMELAQKRRGIYKTTEYIGEERAILIYEMPLANIIIDFYDKLKSVSKGYASMSYEILDFREADLVKLDILIADERVDAFSMLVYRNEAEIIGRKIVKKLKDLIPKHLFQVPVQAAVGGKIMARETIPALKKDVTAKLYGGDVTRKRKLLEKQKKGKKRLKRFGKVDIPQEAFLEVLKR